MERCPLCLEHMVNDEDGLHRCEHCKKVREEIDKGIVVTIIEQPVSVICIKF